MLLAWIAWHEDQEFAPVPHICTYISGQAEGVISKMWADNHIGRLKFADNGSILVFDNDDNQLPEPGSAVIRHRDRAGFIDLEGPFGQHLIISGTEEDFAILLVELWQHLSRE